MLKNLTLTLLFLAASTGAFAQEEGFVSLFDGKTLNGWSIKGGQATYHVEDGTIVGVCTPNTPMNTFLCTDKEYGNFILKLEFKVLQPGNSGVQFRSHARPAGDRQSVFGYQCEIAEYPAMCKIYDEGRRGFKHGRVFLPSDEKAAEEAFKTYKKGEWNEIEIQCVGPSIRTWFNGVPVTNIFDPVELSGFIGLQIHAGKSGKMAWRNLRIKDLGKSEWKPFFVKEGDTWKVQGCRYVLPECWSFDKDGILTGSHDKTEKRDGLVVTDANYSDFAARVSYQLFGGNSALYFRAEEVNTSWLLRGFQNEIAGNAKDSALWHTAGEPGTPGRGWVATADEFIEKVRNKEGWNTTCTIAIGDRIVEFLNDFQTIDIVDPKCEKSGKLGLQLHGGADVKMTFKNFEYLEITPEMRKLIER
ncbi:MAG: DUF1080 domain-containing protein [Planctomycetia bacterium]|nr:DUF1080 domain-containing protein [Planctomycetia bacterium]